MQTSTTPTAGCPGPDALLPVLVPANQEPAATITEPPKAKTGESIAKPPPTPLTLAQPQAPLPAKLALGTVDLRTAEEELEFQECESIVGEATAHFARAGHALIRIREKRLYKNEYPSFEVYCYQRWGFARAAVWRYISAAQVHSALATIPGIPMPDCEAQVRPLIGLPDTLAAQAWMQAIGWTRDRYVPPKLVKRAVKQLVKTNAVVAPKSSKPSAHQRSEARQAIQEGFTELLSLLLGRAEHEVLLTKVQSLERLVNTVLPVKKKGC